MNQMRLSQWRHAESATKRDAAGQLKPSILNLSSTRGEKSTSQRSLNTMLGFNDFISDVSWDDATSRPLQTWTQPQGQNVMVGEGSGQVSSPFSVTAQVFSRKCSEIGFSRPFLDKLVPRSSLFEYRFVFPESTGSIATALSPSHLEVAMANYENDSFFCLFRYGLIDRKSDCLLFLKTGDYLKQDLIKATDFILCTSNSHAKWLYFFM